MADPQRLEALRAMLADDPGDAFTRYAVGLELAGLGRRAEALSALEALATEQPEYVATYYQYAALLQAEGQPERAAEVARRGLEAAAAAGDDHAASELTELLEELDA